MQIKSQFTNFEGKIKKIFAHVQKHNEKSLKMFLNTGWIINNEQDKNTKNEITIEFDLK
jgi:uncharacterized protein YqgV (UPF0045/DUF77 family)